MAVTKDYYRILNVRSTASDREIKNAYRKLAMKYHPDRNPDDALSAAVFTDVAEAYKILSDEKARKQYNQQRYITAAQEYKRPAETIEVLIERIKKINTNIKDSDPFRFNKDALLFAITQLLPADISMLLRTKTEPLRQFLEMIILAVKHLASHQTKQIILLLEPLYEKNEWLLQQLNVLYKQQQKEERWEKNKIILAVLLAIIFCILIFFAARK